jgi:hypothetical protein
MKTKSTKNTNDKIVVNIKPGPVSPAQREAWRKLWQMLITETKNKSNKERIQ